MDADPTTLARAGPANAVAIPTTSIITLNSADPGARTLLVHRRIPRQERVETDATAMSLSIRPCQQLYVLLT